MGMVWDVIINVYIAFLTIGILSIRIEITIAKIIDIINPSNASIKVIIICSFSTGKFITRVLIIVVGAGKIEVGTTSILATNSQIKSNMIKKLVEIILSILYKVNQ